MSNKISVALFENEHLRAKIRTVVIDGDPWFVGKDVADYLAYANTKDALKKLVPDKYKRRSRLATPWGVQSFVLINEAGLYKLIFRSTLPKAVEFSDWVCEDVLPKLRRTGEYHLAWHNERTAGKKTHSAFETLLHELYLYGVRRGEFDHDEGLLHTNYNRLINKTVGLNAGERDLATQEQLAACSAYEFVVGKIVRAGMAAARTIKEIYAACKAQLEKFGQPALLAEW